MSFSLKWGYPLITILVYPLSRFYSSFTCILQVKLLEFLSIIIKHLQSYTTVTDKVKLQ